MVAVQIAYRYPIGGAAGIRKILPAEMAAPVIQKETVIDTIIAPPSAAADDDMIVC